jgi:hypothetical protein
MRLSNWLGYLTSASVKLGTSRAGSPPVARDTSISPDRGHIAIGKENAVKYLFRHLRVSREVLRRAVDSLIRLRATASVRKELGE